MGSMVIASATLYAQPPPVMAESLAPRQLGRTVAYHGDRHCSVN